MTEAVMNILQWLIPGGSLASVLAWFFSRTLRSIRKTKEIHDTYKTLYEDISNTLKDVQTEVEDLHRELGKFRRSVAKMYGCRYYSDCPVRHELLQNGEAVVSRSKVSRKRQRRTGNKDTENNSCSGGEGEADDTVKEHL